MTVWEPFKFLLQNASTGMLLKDISDISSGQAILRGQLRRHEVSLHYAPKGSQHNLNQEELSTIFRIIYRLYYRREENLKPENNIYNHSLEECIKSVEDCFLMIEGMHPTEKDLQYAVRQSFDSIVDVELKKYFGSSMLTASEFVMLAIDQFKSAQNPKKRKKVYAWLVLYYCDRTDLDNIHQSLMDLGINFKRYRNNLYTFTNEDDVNLLQLTNPDLEKICSLVRFDDLMKVQQDTIKKLQEYPFFRKLMHHDN